ncbi:MAG: MFS transporter [Bacteroidales bacterium]
MGVHQHQKKTFRFPRTFWLANVMELFERWAWYGIFIILAIYLTASRDEGALGFTQVQKGYLMGTVVGILYILPVITGAIADKAGYKKILILSFLMLSSGYMFMAFVTTYAAMFVVFLYVAIGAGLFKPVISATIAKTTNKENATVGFGIFYMIVNIGAFIGPVFAAKMRVLEWKYAFIISALAIAVNIILVVFFYKEPPREKTGESLGNTLASILKNLLTALRDVKLIIFLLIIVGFWTMYNQLFFTLPVFIDQWVDTHIVYENIRTVWPWLAGFLANEEQGINAELLVNIDALYIVIFQVAISSVIKKIKPVNTIITGFLISAVGIGLWFVTQNGMYLFITILVFAVGEMASSPRILEYIGNIAPKDKVAMYMGTYYLPLAGGNFLAGILSGDTYTRMSDKTALLQKEVARRGLDIPEISENVTQNDYFSHAGELLGMNPQELTDYLWNTYQPGNIWMVFTGIGMGTVLLLFLFDRIVLRRYR